MTHSVVWSAANRRTLVARARRVALASVAVIALLAASACGGNEGENVGGSTTGSTLPDAEVPGGPSINAPGAPGVTNGVEPPSGGDGGQPTRPGQPGQPGTTGGPALGPAPSATDGSDGNVEVGQFAPIVLRPNRSTRVVVEVLAQDGATPRPGTTDHVVTVLEQVTEKPVTKATGGVPGGSRTWSAADIRAAADSASRPPQGNGTAVLRLLYLHGRFGDEGVLGVSVRGDTIAVFVDEVASASTPVVSPASIEDAVTMHEVGHLLGLVDLFLATGREDPEHPGHSRNRRSVMYWGVETNLVAQVLGGPPPRDFDDDDLADLASIRSGAGG